MKYELRRGETLGDGLRRICRKQVLRALAIARGERETDDTPVHEMRKHLKKARAALALVKREIGQGSFKRLDRSLRDSGKLTSEVRDAEVRLQTVREVQGIVLRQKRRTYPKIEEMLMLELQSFVAAFAEWQVQAIPLLEKAAHEIDNWSLDSLACGQLRRAVQQTYKSGRDALAQARATSAMADFHAFRIEAKQLWYQLRILQPVNPVVLKSLGDELHSIGDFLGRAHDMSFLGERLRRERGRSEFGREGQELLALIETTGSDLQRAASELAERFYAERPRDFGERVAGWLEDWAAGKEPSLAGQLVR